MSVETARIDYQVSLFVNRLTFLVKLKTLQGNMPMQLFQFLKAFGFLVFFSAFYQVIPVPHLRQEGVFFAIVNPQFGHL